jgi:predicted NodU family carbamoyl transferase
MSLDPILGLNAFHADSSAVLLRDAKLIAAAEEERIRRIKHWAGFPSQAIAYCLAEADAQLSDVDYVAFNQDNRASFLRKVGYFLTKGPTSTWCSVGCAIAAPEQAFERAFPAQTARGKLRAASAFYVCPFDQAAVVSVDAFGDFSSAAWGDGGGPGNRDVWPSVFSTFAWHQATYPVSRFSVYCEGVQGDGACALWPPPRPSVLCGRLCGCFRTVDSNST